MEHDAYNRPHILVLFPDYKIQNAQKSSQFIESTQSPEPQCNICFSPSVRHSQVTPPVAQQPTIMNNSVSACVSPVGPSASRKTTAEGVLKLASFLSLRTAPTSAAAGRGWPIASAPIPPSKFRLLLVYGGHMDEGHRVVPNIMRWKNGGKG